MESKKPVIIIGAGISGLHAAHELELKKIPFVILEAQDYVGGRIKSLEGFAEFPLSEGAEEIHGFKSSHRELANEFGVQLVPQENLDRHFFINGKAYKEEELELAGKEFKEANDFVALEGFMDVKLTEDMTLKNYIISKQIPKEAWFMYELFAQWFGCSWEELSIKSVQEIFSLLGTDDGDTDVEVRPPWTNADLMKAKYGYLYDKVQLKTPVTKIELLKDGVKVWTESGTVIEGDSVIVTVPLSIIKKGLIEFVPPLPKEKVEAMNNLHMRSGGKVFVKFKKNFWGSDLGTMYLDGFVKIWSVPGHLFPIEKNRILSGYLIDKECEELYRMPLEKQKETIFADLEKVWGSVVREMYEDHYISNWGANKHIQGAYSCPLTPGEWISKTILRKNIEGRVFFSGEHLDVKGYSQTVSGSIDTAKLAVEELIQRMSEEGTVAV